MQCPYNSCHIATRRKRLNLLLVGLKSKNFAYFVQGSLVAVLVDQIHQLLPISLIQPLELAHILLFLPIRAKRYTNHIRGTETANIKLDISRHKGIIKRTWPL